VLNDSAEEYEIRPSADRLPGLIFVPVPEAKESKNRLHPDLRPDDQQAEVGRFLRAGASGIDIGQGSVPWVVMADPEDSGSIGRVRGGCGAAGEPLGWDVLQDPEGNEFCVFTPDGRLLGKTSAELK
jgi:hypothetical protein